ncbi:NAC domain-containing protein 92-like [Alnus glutinosa]|uniref:NAC domain-containing protein 92-like n=1 Tax=Alnus glutinosa TaxID=3517 RepID=UPI002D79080F|nr:NAC domain-containing protein 92-like [Alnus glutinosa]
MALSDNACVSLSSSVHESNGGEEEEEEEDLDLPVGYRFCPEDDELITHYLKNKLLGRPLSANIIRDIDLYEYDPDQLPIDQFKYGKGDEAYYFTNTRLNRATKHGYWKETGEDEQVFGGDSDEIVGFKKILNFYWGQEPNGEKSQWIMKEFILHPSIIPADALSDSITQKMGRFVVCRIQTKEDEGNENSTRRFF